MTESQPDKAKSPLYLDDVAVGQRFESGTHVLDAEQIVAFARQFDPQPFHLDAEAAKHSLFGELVASGWHTAALTMRLLVTTGFPIAGGLVGVGGEINWPAPARPGDILKVEGEVAGIVPSRSKPDRGIVTIRSETKNQKGDVLQIMTAKLLMFRRS